MRFSPVRYAGSVSSTGGIAVQDVGLCGDITAVTV
jgi:hypothetical protein